MDSGTHRIVVDVIDASNERFQREHAFEGISDLFAIHTDVLQSTLLNADPCAWLMVLLSPL